MRRFSALLLLLLLALALAACGGTNVIVVTTTPPPVAATDTPTWTPEPEATPTWVTVTPEATPTRELGEVLDCQTLTLEPANGWRVVNANYCFTVMGSVLWSERPGNTDDDRQWDRLDEYQIIYRPGETNKPPWVFWQDVDKSHPRGLRMELGQIAGEFGYAQGGIFLQGGTRYVLKLEGMSEIINTRSAVVGLAGRLKIGSEFIDLPIRYIEQTGPVEVLWVVESSRSISLRWDAWVDIIWASAFGAYTWQGMLVMEAPTDDWGEDVLIEIEG